MALLPFGSAPTPDATTLRKGKVQLAGDLGGTAASPTVPTKVAKSGDTMTGLLVLSADPAASLGAATKQYVDNQAATTGLVQNEVPGGSVNSSNTAFTTASAFATNSLRVYRNGVRLKGGGADFTAGASAFTMVTAPTTGDVLLVDYNVSSTGFSVGTNSIITQEVPTGTINGVTTAFTTARAYIAGSLIVYKNRTVLQGAGADYTETTPGSGIFTFVTAPATGDTVFVGYQYNLNPSSNADTVDGIHANTTATANTLYPLNSNGKLDPTLLDTTLGAWASWTPSLVSMSGGTITTAKYTQIGKTVHAVFVYALAGANVSGAVTLSLPVTASANFNSALTPIGQATYENSGVATYMGYVDIDSTTTAKLFVHNAASTYLTGDTVLSSTVPHTWKSGDKIRATLTYEAA